MKLGKNFRRLLIAAVVIFGIVGVLFLAKPGLFMDLGMWLTSSAKHRNLSDEKPAFTLTAKDLSAAFKTDTAASAKYIDKALLVDGTITAIDGSHVSFDNVICNVDSVDLPKLSKLAVGQPLKLQGRLTTYNDLMEEIMLDQCFIK